MLKATELYMIIFAWFLSRTLTSGPVSEFTGERTQDLRRQSLSGNGSHALNIGLIWDISWSKVQGDCRFLDIYWIVRYILKWGNGLTYSANFVINIYKLGIFSFSRLCSSSMWRSKTVAVQCLPGGCRLSGRWSVKAN